jgi:hypothetical protein
MGQVAEETGHKNASVNYTIGECPLEIIPLQQVREMIRYPL